MHDHTYTLIQNNPRFQELVVRRGRFAWLLSAIVLGMYVAFILLIAFAPQLLGASIGGSSITWGIPLGVGVIAASFALTGVYVRRANGEFDRLTQAILAEVQ